MTNVINYKYEEPRILNEISDYIDSTYNQHYAKKIQTTEFIIANGHGTGFCIGNAQKYTQRYGEKGDTPKEWRKDIIKAIHYLIIQLHVHDMEYNSAEDVVKDNSFIEEE
jgi:hypothetical protein